MSAPSVPTFPLLGEPGEWDDLTLTAGTVLLEAEGEPEDGQIAVAFVIGTRMRAHGTTARRVILGPDGRAYDDGRPWEPWSCWNDDYTLRARARLAAATETAWAWKAAAAGLFGLGPDPSRGAYFYVNVDVTKKLRGGSLPSWAADPLDAAQVNAAKVLVVLGRHTFMKA